MGWREWVALLDLGIEAIKVKIDTGARTSSLHAFDVQEFSIGKTRYVRFKVHPIQRNIPDQVVIDGMNMHKKHVRPKKQGEKGKLIDQAFPIHVSNVQKIK
jgi:hypothetical protein